MRRYLYSEDSGLYVPERNVQPWDGRACNWVSAGSCGSCGSIGASVYEDPIAAAVMKYGGFLNDPDFATALTLNTQPDVSGGWEGASWAGAGLGPYTHTAGDATALAAAALIVGNRYQTVFTVSDRTAGSVTYYAGTTAGTARSTNATFTEDLTCAANTSHSFVPSADFDGKVTVVSVLNLSITTITPKQVTAAFAGLTFKQATAANMPWKTSALINGKQGVSFDATADKIEASLAAAAFKEFHGPNGSTLFYVIRPNAVAGIKVLFSTFTGGLIGFGQHGTLLFSNGKNLYWLVTNGAAYVFETGIFGAMSAGNVSIICLRMNSAAFSAKVDNSAAVSGVPAAVPSGADPFHTARLNDSAYALDSQILDVIGAHGYMTDSEMNAIGKALAAKWGGTWA